MNELKHSRRKQDLRSKTLLFYVLNSHFMGGGGGGGGRGGIVYSKVLELSRGKQYL